MKNLLSFSSAREQVCSIKLVTLLHIKSQFVFLGTGSESGIPVHRCDCELCRRAREDSNFIRRPPANLLIYKKKNYLIDVGNLEFLKDKRVGDIEISGIFITHTHISHTMGLFQLRWTRQRNLPIYYPEASELVDGFDKLLTSPSFLGPFKGYFPFQVIDLGDGLKFTPLPLKHTVETFGFFIEGEGFNIAYLSDTKGLPDKTYEYLSERDLDIVILDAMYPPGWNLSDHNNIDEALSILKELKFEKAFLTHISHLYNTEEVIRDRVRKEFPQESDKVIIARDFMIIELKYPFRVRLK